MKFSREAARAMLLAAQGLDSAPERATKDDVRGIVRRMGVLQIDSISVVARSPYLVLWSRLGPYEPVWLDELLAEGALFEYWSHAACFLPIEDYGLYRSRMLEGRAKTVDWIQDHPDEIGCVMDRVREGPVRAIEFERTDGKAGGWWEWKPEKRALEHLFAAGELMISRRDPNFHRVYDLRGRVLEHAFPEWEDALAPTPEEARRALALGAVCSLGVAVARWVPDYYRMPKKGVVDLLEELADEGALLRVGIEGLDGTAYVHAGAAALAETVLSGRLESSRTTLLSPFDPVVWDRARASELFGFDYKIEVYTPAAKRRYGYYALPILHRGALVGRLDAKAHRKQGVFEVKDLHLEPGAPVDDDLVAGLAGALRDCAGWHGTPEVRINRSDPPQFVRALRPAIGEGVAT